METKQFVKASAWLIAVGLAFGLGTAIGQQAPPTESKGFRTGSTAVIDLGPEIQGMQGRQLRLRVLTLEPGGIVGVHSHKDRPAVVYLLQGTLINHRDSATQEIREGTSWSEGKDTTHWVENRGSKPAIFVGADIHKP